MSGKLTRIYTHKHRYNNADLTFRPAVDETSKRIAMQKRDEEEENKAVEERLLSCASTRMQNKIRLQQRYMASLSEECKFRPSISETSRQIASKAVKGSFLERQIARESQRKENYMRDLAKRQPSRQCTFKPEIGNADAVLMCLRPERINETAKERTNRLSVQDREAIAKERKRLEREVYSEYTFKPRIDKHSRAIAPTKSDVTNIKVQSKRAAKKRRDAIKQASEEFRERCPFKPTLMTRRGRRNDDDHLEDDAERMRKIEIRRAQREQKLAQERKEKMDKELSDCTFRPNVNRVEKKKKKTKGPIVVRGLGRFMELKNLAKQKENEQKQREREVFGLKNELSRTHTVPKPFSFQSRKRRTEEKLRREQELREREMKECTFRPRTGGVMGDGSDGVSDGFRVLYSYDSEDDDDDDESDGDDDDDDGYSYYSHSVAGTSMDSKRRSLRM